MATEPIDPGEVERILGRMLPRAVEPLEVRYLIGVRDGFVDPVVFLLDLTDATAREMADLANKPGYSAAAIAQTAPGSTSVVSWVMPGADAVDLAGRFAPHAAATLTQPAEPGCFKVLLVSEGLVLATGKFRKPPE